MKIDPRHPEDELYLTYICTLVLIDHERAVATPDLTHVLYLRTRAAADHAELRRMALRLSLMTGEEHRDLEGQSCAQRARLRRIERLLDPTTIDHYKRQVKPMLDPHAPE